MIRILVVEDDTNLGYTLVEVLKMQDYELFYTTNGDEAMNAFKQFKPDLVILDVLLNCSVTGFEIAELIRTESNTPILFTTSCDSHDDIKKGLNIAYADYIRKPYRLIEVSLRMKNLLKLYGDKIQPSGLCTIGKYRFDPIQQYLQFDGNEVKLQNYESKVLKVVLDHQNCFITRDELIRTVWNEKMYKTKMGALNNIISDLRKYLSHDTSIELISRIGLGVKLSVKS